MKKHFLMDCNAVLNDSYNTDKDNPLPKISRMRINFHLLFCPACSAELKNLRHIEEIFRIDFLPPSPHFDELIMEHLHMETIMEEKTDAPTGFSFRSWVVIGFFVLLSLSSSVFGRNFVQIAAAEGLSFLLPVGLTIGMVVTCYGAIFIGSHLKELSTRFRLH